MAETLFEELRRYVGFGEAEEAALRMFRPMSQPHFAGIVEQFYQRIIAHPSAAAVLRSTEQIHRLKVTLIDWLDRLLGGPWDQDYFDRRSRIGRVHVKVELPQRYMVTAMSGIYADLSQVAQAAYRESPESARQVCEALSRVTALDLAIMLESYRHVTLEQLQRLQRIENALLADKLELTEERYHAVIESAEVLMMLLDSENRVVLFNRKAEELTGWQRAEVAEGQGLKVLIHPADLDKMQKAVKLGGEGREVGAIEARISAREGEEHSIRWHLTRLPSATGFQVLVIGIDVTEERLLEERNRRSERLASLGTLAAGLAHEIRNPLNAAQLQLTVLERRLKNQQATGDGFKLIREELVRLANLVQDFLAFARPTRLRLVAHDLRRVVGDVLDLCEPEARDRGVVLLREIGDDAVVAYIDEERIKQVLLNLIRNGMDAVTNAHGQVTVDLRRIAQRAILRVIDDGPGITEGVSVFEPFSSTKEGGTGLGLPIVHRIVSDHGGDVTFERSDGHTIFCVELPLDGPTVAKKTVRSPS